MAKMNFKKIIKKFFQIHGKDKLKILKRPFRDWGVLLVIFFTLLIFIALANAYLFIQINKEEIFAKERAPEEEIEVLNVEGIKKTIDFFDKREENFNGLLKQKPIIVDPSL